MEGDPNPTAMIQTALLMSRIPDTEPSSDALELASLVRRTLSGDSGAFEQVILRYERRVVTLAMKLLGTTEDAQDAAQEVFLKAYRYLHRLDLQKPIEPWLMRITVNVCRNIGRKRQRRLNTFSESETADAAVAGKSGNPYSEVVEEQERRMLWRALNSLPEKERIAVILRDIEGHSTAEVAAILDSSESTVRSQVSRARVRMKDAIDQMMGGQQ
jgi:RNA polymerase sigma-70 factor (ECF subfamily)